MREFALITAYKFTIENQLAALPVDPARIALQNGFKVFTYTQFSQIVNKSPAYLVMQYDRHGFTFWSTRDHCYVIVYNSRQSSGSMRWTLAHELGHIHMHHVSKLKPRARYGVESPLFEAEAQEFARFVLCPPIVLYLCNVMDSKGIQSLCGIPKREAEFISRRMKYYTRTTIPQEEAVESLYAPFIYAYKQKKPLPAMQGTAIGGENIKRRPALPTPDGFGRVTCICGIQLSPSAYFTIIFHISKLNIVEI